LPVGAVAHAVRTALQEVAGLTLLPGEHVPAWHTPLPPQVVSSATARLRQPLVGSQLSVVQGFSSSQLTCWPPQVPPLQTSLAVQALPSSHATPMAVALQPLVGSQKSKVHGLLSWQATVAPLHKPPVQVSLEVQALLSVQLPVLSAKVQPVWALQPSSVHTLPSAQGNAAPGWHTLLAQLSPTVHRLPSSQEPETAAKLQPVVGLQLSAVQGLLSLQLTGVPTQPPPLQVSLLVHAEASLQVAVLAVNWQPLLVSQLSVVQGLLSPQANAVPG
jgi:hypothetical protein